MQRWSYFSCEVVHHPYIHVARIEGSVLIGEVCLSVYGHPLSLYGHPLEGCGVVSCTTPFTFMNVGLLAKSERLLPSLNELKVCNNI